MVQYYCDTETTGFDFINDKIITIQYQELDFYGKPVKPLVILKEWESSEEDIVRKFHEIFLKGDTWDFISIGFNLIFDFGFLWKKFEQYKLPLEYSFFDFVYTKRKAIDIQGSFIIANNLSFRGSSLDKMTNKEQDGKNVPIWYANKEYDKIEKYIVQETDSFLKVLSILREDLNISKQKWKTSWKDRHPNNIHLETSAHSPSG